VTFRPSGEQIEVSEETSLLEAALAAGETEVPCCMARVRGDIEVEMSR
jgi:hypothetical protein